MGFILLSPTPPPLPATCTHNHLLMAEERNSGDTLGFLQLYAAETDPN